MRVRLRKAKQSRFLCEVGSQEQVLLSPSCPFPCAHRACRPPPLLTLTAAACWARLLPPLPSLRVVALTALANRCELGPCCPCTSPASPPGRTAVPNARPAAPSPAAVMLEPVTRLSRAAHPVSVCHSRCRGPPPPVPRQSPLSRARTRPHAP
jgi:hypothetical protein